MNRILIAITLLLPGVARAQVAGVSPTDRERIAVVGLSSGRMGLLIPLNERWMLRPDFSGTSLRNTDAELFTNVFAGLAVIRRSAPVDGSWAYGSLRYGIGVRQDAYDDRPSIGHALTATAGAHAHVNDWLAVFGETGVAFAYNNELNIGLGDATRDFNSTTRIGIAIQMPRRGEEARPLAPESDRAIGASGEGRSWVIGGHGDVGMLFPLSDRWVIRPDFRFHAQEHRTFATGETAEAGISLLRRVAPTERGWAFGAVRYALDYRQVNAQHPSWVNSATISVGGQVRLRDRLGVMAEAGLNVRHAEQKNPAGDLLMSTTIRLIQRVGLTYRFKDRAP